MIFNYDIVKYDIACMAIVFGILFYTASVYGKKMKQAVVDAYQGMTRGLLREYDVQEKDGRKVYFPVVKFKVSDEIHVAQCRHGFYTRPYIEGEILDVRYDKSDPMCFLVDGMFGPSRNTCLVLRAIGVVMMAGGGICSCMMAAGFL